ncbi:MAG: DegT/DnrJ/EryC1/StrS family aminotransferase [Anaerolineaceae bacterium]
MTEHKNVPLLDLKAQYATIRDEIREALDRVIESQHFINGPEVAALENEVAAYSQCVYGIGVSSGTDALLVALMALSLNEGDEVITTPYTFVATMTAAIRLGARPVLVDIEPLTFNLDPNRVEAAVTAKSRVILPVHLFGQIAEMEPLLSISQKHSLTLIEDAAQAIGAEYFTRRAGSMGSLGCFSFFPSKNLGGFGDGGMVTTSDPGLAQQVKLLRNHGQQPKYHCKVVSGNFRLDELQAAVLRVKLKHLDKWTRARQRNAQTYRRLFTEAELIAQSSDLLDGWGVVLPHEAPDRRHIYNQFVIRAGRRDELKAHLAQCGIGTEIYYPVPMHMQESFSFLGYHPGDFPQSEQASAQSLALPIYPELTEAMQTQVVETILEFYR